MTPAGHLKHGDVESFFQEVFARIGCPAELYLPTIHALVSTSLRGVDSHGIRLMPHYVDAAVTGRINLSPALAINRTSSSTALLDADNTYGTAAATAAMRHSIAMAREHGMGCTAVANSSHFGAAAVYALIAADAGMIGLSFTHSDALVVPAGGKLPYLGTNPICFAAPCEGEQPFCLDMATSATSWNNLRRHKVSGEALEPGWAVDQDGQPCLDPAVAVALLPSGGYKGYGLALMVEILCSLLTGMSFGTHITRMFPVTSEHRRIGHVLIAIDINRFQELGTVKLRMKQLLTELRGQPAAAEGGQVLVANDPEKEQYQRRSVSGIPVSAIELAEFCRIAQSLGIREPFKEASSN
jgi:LDH2 family malate/lactate/ureidoglycolate dehydrogenase